MTKLEEREFVRLSNFIMTNYGIKLPPSKKTLLQCRLQKRLGNLNMENFSQYVKYVFSSKGLIEEVPLMIDAVSTNKTDFFREQVHFDFLYNTGIDDYLQGNRFSKLSVWSAGCSSGEEPYTIAMILKEYASQKSSIEFEILATDIASSVLQVGEQGIYDESKAVQVPDEYKKKYLLKGKNDFDKKVKIIQELRSKVQFRKFNLLSTDYSCLGKFDIIFCRNVLIYFERQLQEQLLQRFMRNLKSGGYLFLGHSESITGFNLPLQQIRPTIFVRN